MKKILLVEDNELNRDMLGRRLKRRGYTVIFAVDGQEGVSKAQVESPDLILMDMSLPAMDGWTATKTLKADQSTASIPVIALTAHAMVGDRTNALAAGCDDYDTKPVDIKRLLGKMEDLFDHPSSVRALGKTAFSSSVKTSLTKPLTAPSPQRPSAPPVSVIQPLSSPSKKATGKILIVDDIAENRDILKRRLSRKGYDTRSANSGEAALDIINTDNISLVLLDIMMPGMGGIETLRQIRQHNSRLDLPVIMVSAKDQSDDMVQAFNLGANDYVAKPVDLSVLLARLQGQLKTVNLSQIVVEAASESESKPPELFERLRPIKVLSNTPVSEIFTAQDLENSDHPLKLVQKIKLNISNPQLLKTAKEIFSKELKYLERIRKHENILLPIDSFEKEGEFYVLSDYVEGLPCTIKDFISASKDPRKIVRMTEEILRIIEPFHQRDIIHHQINSSCFITPSRNRETQLVLIDLGIQNRLIRKLEDMYPTESFLSSDCDDPKWISSLNQTSGAQDDICAIGLMAMQVLTGIEDPQILNLLKFDESQWRKFPYLDREVVSFFKKMVCRTTADAYTSIADANRDILKVWFNLNYKDRASELSR